jgi:hypothetical protein
MPFSRGEDGGGGRFLRAQRCRPRAPEPHDETMIRPILTEVILFLAPFALYAVFLIATRARVLDPQAWSLSRIIWLTTASFLLMIGSFILLAQFGGSPPGATYVPAHIEDGKFVPGTTK